MTTAGELGLRLRPAGPADAEVLYRIYASTREEELAVVPWDAPAKEAFLRMQFTAQHADYHANYPDASYDLILIGEEAAGRLYVHRGERALHVLDIALLPEHRGQGIGTRLFSELLAEAGAAAKPVEIYVERFNPARHLYDRLGFRQIADQGVYQLLEWRSGAEQAATREPLPEHRFVAHRGRILSRRRLVRPDRDEKQIQPAVVLVLQPVHALGMDRLERAMEHQGKRRPGYTRSTGRMFGNLSQLSFESFSGAALRRPAG